MNEKKYPFELRIENYQMDMDIELTVTPNLSIGMNELCKSIIDWISDFNDASEVKKRRPGVVHSYNAVPTEDSILLTLDRGSTGDKFFKSLLEFLSSLQAFKKVVIT